MALCTIETNLCTQLLCTKINGIKSTQTPEIIKYRLKSAGMSPINLLVDVTNYICLDLGQPMHAYDAGKVKGLLKATCLKSPTLLETLDEKKIELTTNDIIIEDESGPLSLAGIMGGLSTAVLDTTTSIILEAAVFDPIAIALSGQKHNISSNSRMRFERGIDPAMTKMAMEKAIDLIIKHSGGTVIEKEFHIPAITPIQISWNPELVAERTGVKLSSEEINNILRRLGCTINGTNVTVPTWRHDLTIPEDLVEEVLRIKGYDHLPADSLPSKPYMPQSEIKLDLTHLGLQECLTLSFTTHEKAGLFAEETTEIANPISADLSTLKPSLLCGLLDTAKHNINYGEDRGGFYEIGNCYSKENHTQTKMVAGLRFGNYDKRTWHSLKRPVDTFDAKSDCLKVLEFFKITEDKVQLTRDVPSYYHPKQSGCLRQGKKILAYFGMVHPFILKAYDIKKPCAVFEIYLDNLPEAKFKPKHFKSSDLPKTHLDLCFLMDDKQDTGPICQSISKNSLLENVSVFDIYKGPEIPHDKKAVAIQFTVVPTDKNLTDQDIQELLKKIINDTTLNFEITLRT